MALTQCFLIYRASSLRTLTSERTELDVEMLDNRVDHASNVWSCLLAEDTSFAMGRRSELVPRMERPMNVVRISQSPHGLGMMSFSLNTGEVQQSHYSHSR